LAIPPPAIYTKLDRGSSHFGSFDEAGRVLPDRPTSGARAPRRICVRAPLRKTRPRGFGTAIREVDVEFRAKKFRRGVPERTLRAISRPGPKFYGDDKPALVLGTCSFTPPGSKTGARGSPHWKTPGQFFRTRADFLQTGPGNRGHRAVYRVRRGSTPGSWLGQFSTGVITGGRLPRGGPVRFTTLRPVEQRSWGAGTAVGGIDQTPAGRGGGEGPCSSTGRPASGWGGRRKKSGRFQSLIFFLREAARGRCRVRLPPRRGTYCLSPWPGRNGWKNRTCPFVGAKRKDWGPGLGPLGISSQFQSVPGHEHSFTVSHYGLIHRPPPLTTPPFTRCPPSTPCYPPHPPIILSLYLAIPLLTSSSYPINHSPSANYHPTTFPPLLALYPYLPPYSLIFTSCLHPREIWCIPLLHCPTQLNYPHRPPPSKLIPQPTPLPPARKTSYYHQSLR